MVLWKGRNMDKLCKDNLMCCDDNCKRCANLVYREYLNLKDYKEIAKKLWIYICIIDDEKETYEELADAIGLSDNELSFCRRLESER